MERHQLIRNDFPSGTEGFDRDSVGAHLAAVAAHVAALEARIVALEVERDTLRRQLGEAREESATQVVTTAPAADSLSPALEPMPVTDESKSSAPVSMPAADGFVSGPPPSAPEAEPDPAPATKASSGEPVNAAEVPARLLASKLALEGVDRETIRNRLDTEYDLEDTDSLLDDVIERLI